MENSQDSMDWRILLECAATENISKRISENLKEFLH